MQKGTQWKSKVQEIFQVCQDELKKTTMIGKKMISASKTNTCMRKAYEELGRLASDALDKNELTWSSQKVKNIMNTIKSCKKDLEEMEGEVQNIKTTTESKSRKKKKK